MNTEDNLVHPRENTKNIWYVGDGGRLSLYNGGSKAKAESVLVTGYGKSGRFEIPESNKADLVLASTHNKAIGLIGYQQSGYVYK